MAKIVAFNFAKLTSLLHQIINYDKEKFYITGPWTSLGDKAPIIVTVLQTND